MDDERDERVERDERDGLYIADAKKSNYRGKTVLMHSPVTEFRALVRSCELMTPHLQRKAKYLRIAFRRCEFRARFRTRDFLRENRKQQSNVH